MEDHKTPCPILEQIMRDQKEQGHTLQKHERELGGIDRSMVMLLDGQRKLFTCIDELNKIAIRNATNIGNIQKDQEDLSDKIGNGLKDEIAKSVLEHAKGENGLEVEKRFQEIEKVMWLPRMVDTKLKKWAVAGLCLMILVGIILIIAYTTAQMWGHYKTTKWGEKPGLMQSLEKEHGVMLDKNAHTHKVDGQIVIDSHENPDGPPLTINNEKGGGRNK